MPIRCQRPEKVFIAIEGHGRECFKKASRRLQEQTTRVVKSSRLATTGGKGDERERDVAQYSCFSLLQHPDMACREGGGESWGRGTPRPSANKRGIGTRGSPLQKRYLPSTTLTIPPINNTYDTSHQQHFILAAWSSHNL
eukprot:scaffold32169_cov78-Skeletonema_dohrnii-CCMP3373.AAC.2